MKLTMNRIADLKCPLGKKDALFFDDEQRGLAVRVGAGGGKVYLVQYTFGGRKRRVALGSVGSISLKAAREASAAVMGLVAQGRDPAADRKEAARQARLKADEAALTLDRLLDDWRALGLADRREAYAEEALRALRRAFAKHLDMPASDLSRNMVVRTLDKLTTDGAAAMANATRRYGAACYSWAKKRGAVESSPFENLPVSATVKRERVLSDAELAAIWRSIEGPGAFNAIVRTLILTGQRREEVAGMTWAELSADLWTWTIPGERAKNGKPHLVPLAPAVADLLRALPRVNDLVFPGLKGAFAGWSKAKGALDKASGVTGWRLHDLRRTMATGLQRLGVRLEVTEAALNHVAGARGGIVGVYQRHDYAAEKRAALEAWAAHVAAIVAGREASGDNVVELRRAGA